MNDNNVLNSVSAVNGTDDREARSKSWIALYCRPRSEKRIAESLSKSGLNTYVPIQKQRRKWSDRFKMVDVVVIPMIVFVLDDNLDLLQISKNSNIIKIFANPGETTPAKIKDAEIERLKFILGQREVPVDFDPSIFKVDGKVRITRGNLIGITGEIVSSDENTSELIIKLMMFGGARLKISKTDLEIIK